MVFAGNAAAWFVAYASALALAAFVFCGCVVAQPAQWRDVTRLILSARLVELGWDKHSSTRWRRWMLALAPGTDEPGRGIDDDREELRRIVQILHGSGRDGGALESLTRAIHRAQNDAAVRLRFHAAQQDSIDQLVSSWWWSARREQLHLVRLGMSETVKALESLASLAFARVGAATAIGLFAGSAVSVLLPSQHSAPARWLAFVSTVALLSSLAALLWTAISTSARVIGHYNDWPAARAYRFLGLLAGVLWVCSLARAGQWIERITAWLAAWTASTVAASSIAMVLALLVMTALGLANGLRNLRFRISQRSWLSVAEGLLGFMVIGPLVALMLITAIDQDALAKHPGMTRTLGWVCLAALAAFAGLVAVRDETERRRMWLRIREAGLDVGPRWASQSSVYMGRFTCLAIFAALVFVSHIGLWSLAELALALSAMVAFAAQLTLEMVHRFRWKPNLRRGAEQANHIYRSEIS